MTHIFKDDVLTLENGQKLAYTKRTGHSETYLVLHGFSGDHLSMKEFAGQLPSSSEVILIDLPGFGTSGDPPEEAQTETARYAEFLSEVIKRLATTSSIILVGHSFGAMVGFAFAVQHPRKLRHFVAICPVVTKRLPTRWLGWLSVEAAHRFGFETTRRVMAWPPVVDLATRYLLSDAPKDRYELIRMQRLREAQAFRPAMLAIGSLTNTFATAYADVQLQIPVTLILASRDNIAGRRDGKWFADHCLKVQAVTLAGNHLLPCVVPQQTAEALRQLLSNRRKHV